MNTMKGNKKIYHVGLLQRGKTFVFQYSETVDGLSCQILEYFGKREGTKKAAKYRLKDKETQKTTLEWLNNLYKRNCKRVIAE